MMPSWRGCKFIGAVLLYGATHSTGEIEEVPRGRIQ